MTSSTARRDTWTILLPFVGAPACFLGGWLLLRPIGGQAEPGGWWTAAHAVWLIGFVLFIAMALQFRKVAAPRTTGQKITVAACAAIVGLSAVANIIQMCLDLVGGFRATDREQLQNMFSGLQELPGVKPAIYGVGAQLIFLGLLVFAVAVALIRRTSAWSAAVVVAGTVVMSVGIFGFGRNNWLVAVGMVLLLAGFAALGRMPAKALGT